MQKLPYNYIRGLVEGEGTFTFYTVSRYMQTFDGTTKRMKQPAFAIKMHHRDEKLLMSVKYTLGLREKLHKHRPYPRPERPTAAAQVGLIVRDTSDLRDIIIPLFYKRLYGHKGKQFKEWLEKMGNEEMVHYSQFLNILYKKGYFDREENKRFE